MLRSCRGQSPLDPSPKDNDEKGHCQQEILDFGVKENHYERFHYDMFRSDSRVDGHIVKRISPVFRDI